MTNTRALILASIAIIGGGVIICWILLAVVESHEEVETHRRAAREEAVGKHQVTVGMTAAQVERSWGKPKRINTTIVRRHTTEQWVYEGSYVHLDNGVVTEISTHERVKKDRSILADAP